MTYRPPPHRSGNPNRAHRPLPDPGSPDDPGGMTEGQQTEGARCTCTGGPYLHGPEGLRQALQEIADSPPHKPPTGGDTDHA